MFLLKLRRSVIEGWTAVSPTLTKCAIGVGRCLLQRNFVSEPVCPHSLLSPLTHFLTKPNIGVEKASSCLCVEETADRNKTEHIHRQKGQGDACWAGPLRTAGHPFSYLEPVCTLPYRPPFFPSPLHLHSWLSLRGKSHPHREPAVVS